MSLCVSELVNSALTRESNKYIYTPNKKHNIEELKFLRNGKGDGHYDKLNNNQVKKVKLENFVKFGIEKYIEPEFQSDEQAMMTPEELKRQFPLSKAEQHAITKSWRIIGDIIHGRDPRLLVVCGPCSIHDTDAAIEYGRRLSALSTELSDQLYIVMRTYFEKPRSTVGWKGLMNDPCIDGSLNIKAGLKIARDQSINLIRMGLPLATEALDPNAPHYLGDLFSCSAIGARTTESQTHREMASGLYMPVGFKNSTDGNLSVAINAMRAAAIPHRLMRIDQAGKICLVKSRGNADGHVILRGGNQPNYHPQDILDCERQMAKAKIPAALVVDCSHGNSNKDYRRQSDVAQSVLAQIKAGNRSIVGIMLESHIHVGSQSSELPRNEMRYGVSITDSCFDWETTDSLLRQLHRELKPVLKARQTKSYQNGSA